MSEIAVYQPQSDLSVQMDYARAVADGSLLPDTYRGKPANVLIAIGLGSAMGLSHAESLYRIDVIQGKPTASAELIAANVRKAGHKLRVKGDDQSCTATIIRKDDPDFPFEITRDLAWAQRMGLTNKSNYKSQPGTMLQWRAISAVARLACPEALYGVAYTPDEMYDDAPAHTVTAVQQTAPAAERMGAILGTQTAAPGEPLPLLPESAYPEGAVLPDGSPLLNTSSRLAKAMYASLHEKGISNDAAHGHMSLAVGREIASSKELTEDEARMVLDYCADLPVDVTDAELVEES